MESNFEEATRVLAVVGPTASGKSALAVALAREFDGEIISCDSMQIYRGMDIGTATPTPEEMAGIPHHLLNFVSPRQDYSAADYAADAQKAVQEITTRGKLPIFCGGTGLYLDGAVSGRHRESFPALPAYRAELTELAEKEGGTALYAMLSQVDPLSAQDIHPNNVKRVIRALEIYRATGIPKSEWDARSRLLPPVLNPFLIGLAFSDRALLYDRIDRRVDAMMRAGLEEEARHLWENRPLSACAMQAIGYKELFAFFEGECDRDTAVNGIKQASRNYAKRQMTWLSRYKNIHNITVDRDGAVRPSSEIAAEACELVKAQFS